MIQHLDFKYQSDGNGQLFFLFTVKHTEQTKVNIYRELEILGMFIISKRINIHIFVFKYFMTVFMKEN